jgi:geranylgeranyl diphosphate synthase type II
MNSSLTDLQNAFSEALERYRAALPSDNLHTPINYILNLGGKRIRPVLLLLSANAFGKSSEKAMPAALAIELFHNFTLMHDDIMDAAPLRRGKATVHEKWNTNTAILSGDAMMIEAYKLLTLMPAAQLPEMLGLFNTTAMDVCQGQQHDMDFEKRDDVSLQEYLEMIALKTAVLLGCSLKLGAIAGGAAQRDADLLFTFGKMAGVGFQIQDDYLDAFGDAALVGKQTGGDILANKKTCLIIRAMEKASTAQRVELSALYFGRNQYPPEDKVAKVLELFRSLKIDEETISLSKSYFAKAEQALTELPFDAAARAPFEDFLEMLGGRKY